MDDDFHVGAQSTKKVYKVHICVDLLENIFSHCAAMHMLVFSLLFFSYRVLLFDGLVSFAEAFGKR